MATLASTAFAAGAGLRSRVAEMSEANARLWSATPAELPALGPRVGFFQHFRSARAATRLIDRLASELENLPDAEPERDRWRESVRDRVQRFGADHLGWPDGYRRLVFGDAYFDASLAFAREARSFDPRLPVADLWQALRNVWIGNSLQMILRSRVRLSPGLFAYSMLYPLTDNLIDDPRMSGEAKRDFSRRLGQRLTGVPVRAASDVEASVFRLIERIETEFPRQAFEDVHESLLAIHSAQVRSLSQQDDPGLTDAEILAISCAKGGSSVLADLYLVAGTPSAEAERFAFGYGVVLQLLDDLQDVQSDAAIGHQTLFTRAAARGPLDTPTARLACFVPRVLEAHRLVPGPGLGDEIDMIRRNCLSLLVGAVVEQSPLFTRGFRRALARRWPFSFRATRSLRRRAERRFRRAAAALERRKGTQPWPDFESRLIFETDADAAAS